MLRGHRQRQIHASPRPVGVRERAVWARFVQFQCVLGGLAARVVPAIPPLPLLAEPLLVNTMSPIDRIEKGKADKKERMRERKEKQKKESQMEKKEKKEKEKKIKEDNLKESKEKGEKKSPTIIAAVIQATATRDAARIGARATREAAKTGAQCGRSGAIWVAIIG